MIRETGRPLASCNLRYDRCSVPSRKLSACDVGRVSGSSPWLDADFAFGPGFGYRQRRVPANEAAFPQPGEGTGRSVVVKETGRPFAT